MARPFAHCLLVLAVIAGSALPVHAQPASPPAANAWQGNNPTAVLDRGILRLSEIAGALAFLRALCAAPDAAEWPQLMQQLLAAEGYTPERKQRIAGAYNNGYRNYALTYRTCTDSAREAAARYLRESNKLSTGILQRYGN